MTARVRTRLAALAAGCTPLLVGAWLLVGAASAPAGPAGSGVSATALRVDTQTNPIGLGDATPALSWRLAGGRQSAYQIRVASSEAQLDQPDLWDSGKVTSGDTNNIAYGGAALKSRQAVIWDVRVWDGSGAAGDWSAPAMWEMGLLSNSDWSAKWIENPDYTYATADVPNPLPIFAKPFDLSGQVAKARLYMTGLGQYAAKLNGKPVGDAVLEPGQTSYFAEVDYRTYDVTSLLKQGANLLGVETGSGAYQRVRTGGRYFFQNNPAPVYGAPKTIAQLEITYADGSKQTIGTDTSWKTQLGPTTFSSWWSGEDYDARRQPPDWTSSSTLNGTWRDAGLVTLTSSTTPTDTTPLIADQRPPVTIAREARPVAINPITRAALNTTLAGPAGAGDTNVKLASIAGLNPGDSLSLEGESRKITAVGTAAGAATTLFSPAAAGDTNVKVGSVAGFIAGQTAIIDNEVVTVSAVGTAGTATTLSAAAAAGATNLRVASVTNLAAGDSLAINTGANQETVTIASVGTAGANGTGIDITPALTRAQASGTAVRDQSNAGTGLTLSTPLASAHAIGGSARGGGTGVTLASALSAAHAAATAAVSTPSPTYVLDYGKQLSGLPRISVSGAAGTTVTLIPSEAVNADGTLNIGSTGGSATSQILYRYTPSGNGAESWHSQFTYNGFRYLQVTGLPAAPTQDNVTVLVTHASNRETATFDSSSDLLDQIYAISKQALENNMQSVLTDCPDREKGPYTGDNLHNIDTELTLFDMQMYEGQLVNNMRTAQRPVPANGQFPGMIANIAPEYHFVPAGAFNGRWFLDEPNWGGAVIMIPWNLYQVYGDTKAMRENYDAMVKWLDWEATTKADNNGNIRGLGDWSAAQSTDPQPVIDYGYYRGASTMAKIAALLGNTADADKYSALASSLKDEYNAKYLHTDDQGHAWYANNTEASNAVALDAGLVPAQYHDAVVDSLVAGVHAYGDRIGTGSVALGPLFRTLHAAGRDDVIYTMVANPASPGYAFLVNSGKTALTESLSGTGSQDHHFLGEVASWFVHGLVGIQQAPGSIAYRNLEIRPALVGDLNHAQGSYATPQGDVAASWTRAANGLLSSLAVTVPANATARVYVPTSSPSETFVAGGGATVTYVGYQNGAQVYDVADGSTTFVHGTSTDTTVGGTVPASLSLTLGQPASFGAFAPGVAKEYTASTTANVVSTAGDAALTVSDPGHLTNGSFSLPEALRVDIAPASWTGPVSNAAVAITFRQHIGAGDALRTGSYAKTLTFTLSTTTP